MENSRRDELKGSADHIIYMNGESGFCVLLLDAGGEPVTVVGEIGDIDEGEELHLYGEYVSHPRYGKQFKASLCERELPSSLESIQKYLAGGVIKGIGPVLSKAIVKKFGEETFFIFENAPERLAEVDGINLDKAEKLSAEFKRKFAVRRLMSYLASNGITASVGVKAYKAWGDAALAMVEKNPYCLCSPMVGLPFSKADELGANLDLPLDCDYRVQAGIINVLYANSVEGHTCLPTDRLREKSTAFLGVSGDRFDEVLALMHGERTVVSYTKKNGRTYEMLHDLAAADLNISRRLNIIKSLTYDSKIDYSEVIDTAEEISGIKYERSQREAINAALSVGFLVLTGGPGTGKTTTLNAIISLFEQQGMNVLLAAPTGRAAKRMTELTGCDAKTIHRLLEVEYASGEIPRFVHNEENTLDCDVLVVDEMSMVDTLLFDALLRALPLKCKLVLVGDSDQLPSVGAGNLLKDIIDSGVVPSVRLTEVFRQAKESRIVVNAHRIISGKPLERGNCDDFFFFSRPDYKELQELIVELCRSRLPAAYGIDPMENIQVISPSRQGPCGTIELNKLLQNALNPPSRSKAETKTFLYTLRVGDKVMQNKNNYDIVWKKLADSGEVEEGSGIFNGDIGVILSIDKAIGAVTLSFDGRECEYNTLMLENLELAYAVTVHKSQGCEFDYVIFAAFSSYDKLCYRNLLYTAFTRARCMLVAVGSMEVLNHMISNNRRANRYTCLKEMLEEDNGDEMDI